MVKCRCCKKQLPGIFSGMHYCANCSIFIEDSQIELSKIKRERKKLSIKYWKLKEKCETLNKKYGEAIKKIKRR